MIEPDDQESVKKWLASHSINFSLVCAARAAMRVLPLCGPYIRQDPSKHLNGFFLILLQSLSVTWAMSIWPSARRELLEVVNDASEMWIVDDPTADSVVFCGIYAACAAGATYDGLPSEAADSAANALHCELLANFSASLDDRLANLAVNADFVIVERGYTPQQLAFQPLWMGSVPDEIETAWSYLKGLLINQKSDWHVWTDWYEDRMRGSNDPRSMPLIEELEVQRTLEIHRHWESGAEHVNALIGEIEAKYRAQVPEQKPASAQFIWGDDGKLHVLPPVPPKARDGAQEARRRAAWVAHEEHLSAFEKVLKAGNFQALDPVLVSYRKALGDRFEDLNVVSLGIHGARVESLARRTDDILMGVAASELESFAGSHGMFIRQFDEWHDYEADSERTPAQEEVTALVQAAKEIAAETGILASASSEVLEEVVQSVEVMTIGDGQNDKVPPTMEALKNARRSVGNALSELFRPILERVREGSLDGLEEGCKRFVSSAIYRGLGVGLPVLAAHHFGWISYVMKAIEPALKAAGLL
ncbi:hypothetical protein NUH88_13890 [Nisaea acidiphila]|uniref:Uncharacterized protein n=1 Tax=Nisaea acidiphila TaxID=1862145 RepID=A0A9J7ALH2_9PROT|nr:hypothetical protein [Nisaea acidiphila]UUX48499.1 hypothetical protein NUH88_13890 [Nisaea acidiphila]